MTKPFVPYLRWSELIDAPQAHPLMRQLIRLMNKHKCSAKEMCERVGINRCTFNNWRRRYIPKLDLLEACYNVFGYTLNPTRIAEIAHIQNRPEA